MDGQRREPGKELQIVKTLYALGERQLADVPQLVRHDGRAGRFAEQFAHIRVERCVLNCDGFDDAAYGVARVGSVAHKPVVPHGDGNDFALTAGKRHRARIGVTRHRWIVGVEDHIDRIGARDADFNIFAVIAAFRLNDGRCGAHGVNFALHVVICDAVEHLLGIEQLVLRHIRLRQRQIQPRGVGILRNGAHQRILSLGVVAVFHIRIGQQYRQLIIFRFELCCELIHTDGAVIAPGLVVVLAPVGEYAHREIRSVK